MAQDLTRNKPGREETLVFRTINHNEGGGYDASTGVFTAPRAGIYLFLATLQGVGLQHSAGMNTVKVALMQDHQQRQRVLTQADREGDRDSTSLQAVLRLAAGSSVWLQAVGTQNYLSSTSLYCSFSGALITPY